MIVSEHHNEYRENSGAIFKGNFIKHNNSIIGKGKHSFIDIMNHNKKTTQKGHFIDGKLDGRGEEKTVYQGDIKIKINGNFSNGTLCEDESFKNTLYNKDKGVLRTLDVEYILDGKGKLTVRNENDDIKYILVIL